jgi:hypothetical protein
MAIDGGLRSIFRDYLPRLHWQSIESALMGGGIPDANYCCDGIEGWIEYKQTKVFSVKFRPDQVGWHEYRSRKGGRTFVAVRREWGQGDSLYIYRGRDIRLVKLHGVKAPPLAYFAGNPSQWDWRRIENILLSKTK